MLPAYGILANFCCVTHFSVLNTAEQNATKARMYKGRNLGVFAPSWKFFYLVKRRINKSSTFNLTPRIFLDPKTPPPLSTWRGAGTPRTSEWRRGEVVRCRDEKESSWSFAPSWKKLKSWNEE